MNVTVGLERCLDNPPEALSRGRFGLLCNQASLDRRFRYAHELFAAQFPGRLAALFSPQHGLWGEQQANMIVTPHEVESTTGLVVHSLYSETRKPKPEMLDDLDALVIDLQDVGTRIYTFVWTATHCLEACAERGVKVIVLDRPNPIGGTIVEGPLLDPAFASFVGRAPIPMRHGLTIGELLRFCNRTMGIGADLEIVPLDGWRRDASFSEIDRVWVTPSPNLPRVEGVHTYPGMVLLEGTNLSEGRGTTTPFEVFGAPFVDPHRLRDALAAFELAGVTFRPVRFVPTFDKWKGQRCGGLFLHVTDRQTFRPYRAAVALLASAWRLWPDDCRWLDPPYEYETVKPPIDILAGGSALRTAISSGVVHRRDLDALTALDVHQWHESVASHLLYDPAAEFLP